MTTSLPAANVRAAPSYRTVSAGGAGRLIATNSIGINRRVARVLSARHGPLIGVAIARPAAQRRQRRRRRHHLGAEFGSIADGRGAAVVVSHRRPGLRRHRRGSERRHSPRSCSSDAQSTRSSRSAWTLTATTNTAVPDWATTRCGVVAEPTVPGEFFHTEDGVTYTVTATELVVEDSDESVGAEQMLDPVSPESP